MVLWSAVGEVVVLSTVSGSVWCYGVQWARWWYGVQ